MVLVACGHQAMVAIGVFNLVADGGAVGVGVGGDFFDPAQRVVDPANRLDRAIDRARERGRSVAFGSNDTIPFSFLDSSS